MKLTFLPHARERMEERGITEEEEVRWALQEPDSEYPGNLGRIIAERIPADWRLAIQVSTISQEMSG